MIALSLRHSRESGNPPAFSGKPGLARQHATPEELRNALATVAHSHGISDLARRSGISRPGIYKALGEDGNPSSESLPRT